jgi:hypothetical protein
VGFNSHDEPHMVLINENRWRMIMKKIATSALLALSILGAIASAASAAGGEEFGTRTAPQQQPSPN